MKTPRKLNKLRAPLTDRNGSIRLTPWFRGVGHPVKLMPRPAHSILASHRYSSDGRNLNPRCHTHADKVWENNPFYREKADWHMHYEHPDGMDAATYWNSLYPWIYNNPAGVGEPHFNP